MYVDKLIDAIFIEFVISRVFIAKRTELKNGVGIYAICTANTQMYILLYVSFNYLFCFGFALAIHHQTTPYTECVMLKC